MRDVLEKRFGLKSRRMTLEAIGRDYKITRERVRQIEAEALKQVGKEDNISEFNPLFRAIEEHVRSHGEVMAEPHLLTTLVGARNHNHVLMLLGVGRLFHKFPESDSLHCRWAISKDAAEKAEQVLNRTVAHLEEAGRPVSKDVLVTILGRFAKDTLGTEPQRHVLDSFLASSKLIRANPFEEHGLVSWPTISPRGVKDKAYVVLEKAGKPMHFTEVAQAINRTGWSKRKAHPQTVHNELIKDSRFVLVGRGLYALGDWGYEPGVVRDVITSILQGSSGPLSKDEIIRLVSEKRFVKAPTILLNLQNRSLFRRTEEGKYTLV